MTIQNKKTKSDTVRYLTKPRSEPCSTTGVIQLVKFLANRNIKNSEDFLKLKQNAAAQLKMPLPDNVSILEIYQKLLKKRKIKKNRFFEKLKKRPVRSLSGIAVISVLTKPFKCPGQCLFCPSEKNLPKSYVSGEPAVERAKYFKFDPYLQVKKRIEALEKLGHPTDKIELIVIGGSWSVLPKRYQTWFIKECFRGANEKKSESESKSKKTLRKLEEGLTREQKRNEKTKHRIIGLTLETRPDLITPPEILMMRKLGATRIEIGVQILNDKILNLNNRGHSLKEIVEATLLLREAGFKICYHLMFGLPFSSFKKDVECFKKVFADSRFRPDMLKLYPCVVIKGSKLFKLWQKKKYIPCSNKILINLLTKTKLMVPPYVRINRVIRDIPATKIEAGSKISNLRETVLKELKKRGLSCQCIRCKEIKNETDLRGFKLVKREYESSRGKEIFLSFENQPRRQRVGAPIPTNMSGSPDVRRGSEASETKNKLVAFLRLRLQNNFPKYFKELKNAALIREVHTYGELTPIGGRKDAAQHQGFGKKLINEAEKIAEKNGFKKMAVISGIGAREYYRKLGYRLMNTYMIKSI